MHSATLSRSLFVTWILIATSIAFTSCSNDTKSVKVHRVSGTLTAKDAPAPNLIIHFEPTKGGRGSTGRTDAKGTFEMRYEKDRLGVVPGQHKVWIEYFPSNPAEEMQIREGKSPLSEEMQLTLKKYGSAESTPYQITIDGDKKDLSIKLD